MGENRNFNTSKDKAIEDAINKVLIRQHAHRYWEVLQKIFGNLPWEEDISFRIEAEKVMQKFEDENYPRDKVRATIGNTIKNYLKEESEQEKILDNVNTSLFSVKNKVWILESMAEGNSLNTIVQVSKVQTVAGQELFEIIQADKEGAMKPEKKEILSPAEERFYPKTNYKNTIKKHPLKDDFTELQKGKISSQVIYEWRAGQRLDVMDKDLCFLYTRLINSQIITLFQGMFSYDKVVESPKIKECFLKMEDWLDIGSGNGQVTNDIALMLYNYRWLAIMEKVQELFAYRLLGLPFQEIGSLDKKINLTYCDLSWESLQLAKDLATNNFYDLEKFYTINVKNDSFQNVLKNAPPRSTPQLITMLNVLANFEEKELKNIMKDMYEHIQLGDCFIPTFFTLNKAEKVWESKKPHQKELIKSLYDNKETKDWILTSFCERYQIPEENTSFRVSWDNDGRDYISVDIVLQPGTKLLVPNSDGDFDALVAWEQVPTVFNAFKSYRMTKEQIEELCLGAGFKIDAWLDDRFWLQTAPILYKE